jgi:hypothetical protein
MLPLLALLVAKKKGRRMTLSAIHRPNFLVYPGPFHSHHNASGSGDSVTSVI